MFSLRKEYEKIVAERNETQKLCTQVILDK